LKGKHIFIANNFHKIELTLMLFDANQ